MRSFEDWLCVRVCVCVCQQLQFYVDCRRTEFLKWFDSNEMIPSLRGKWDMRRFEVTIASFFLCTCTVRIFVSRKFRFLFRLFWFFYSKKNKFCDLKIQDDCIKSRMVYENWRWIELSIIFFYNLQGMATVNDWRFGYRLTFKIESLNKILLHSLDLYRWSGLVPMKYYQRYMNQEKATTSQLFQKYSKIATCLCILLQNKWCLRSYYSP